MSSNIPSLLKRINALLKRIERLERPPVIIRTFWGNEPQPAPAPGEIVIKTVWTRIPLDEEVA